MTENVENLMLEHLKRFQATLERIESKISKLTTRQNETHSAVIALRRDQAQDAEVSAHHKCSLMRYVIGWIVLSVASS